MEKTSSPELLRAYEQAREITNNICKQAMHGIPKTDLLRVGATLGVLHNDSFYFNNEAESSLLFDYSMHHDYQNGLTPLNRYFFAMQAKLSALEIRVLKAMLDAAFTIFMVLETIPYGGVLVEDVVSKEIFLLMDKNLSNLDGSVVSENTQLIFGATLIRFKEFTMTTGAPVLMTSQLASDIEQNFADIIEKYDHLSLAPKETQSTFVAQFLKTSISTKALVHNQAD